MVDRLMSIYAVIWAIGYSWFVVPIHHWYRQHRRDADYFIHLGWKVGLLVGMMLILWGLEQ